MRFLRTVVVIGFLIGAATSPQFVGAASMLQQPPAPGQEEFVPLSEIPPEEQIPAFTLVASAYAAVWLVLIGYVWSVSRRLQSVERELTTIAGKRS